MRLSSLVPCAALAFGLAACGETRDEDGPAVPPLLQTLGGVEREILVEVRDVAFHADGAVAVLTAPEPAIHVFRDEGYAAFGSKGAGPYELEDPAALAWRDSTFLVLDRNQKKLVAFDADGDALHSRSLGGAWVGDLVVSGTDTVVDIYTPLGSTRSVVRLRGAMSDTLASLTSQVERIRLEAEGSPSFTVSPPYHPLPRYAVLPGAVAAIWHPDRGSGIRLVGDPADRSLSRLGEIWPVTEADREHWFTSVIPEDFMGRRVFEPIRRKARETMVFPDSLPPVLDLEPEPSGGVWIRKTTAGSGEVWTLVSLADEVRGRLRLPVGRRLLAVGQRRLAALAQDSLGVERVELYEKPAWAR